MTFVTVEKKEGHIIDVCVKGHTGYAKAGNDIVCAALSSIVQTAILGLKNVAEIDFGFERNDESGFLRMSIGDLSDKDRYSADIILDTMLCGITDLAEGYPRFIKLEVK